MSITYRGQHMTPLSSHEFIVNQHLMLGDIMIDYTISVTIKEAESQIQGMA